MSDLSNLDITNLTKATFEERLPDLFASAQGKLSEDARLQGFFAENPDCLALVRDFETIAETARSLFEPTEEPSDTLWSRIASKLGTEPDEPDAGLELAE